MDNELLDLIPSEINQIIAYYSSSETLINMKDMNLISGPIFQQLMYLNCIDVLTNCCKDDVSLSYDNDTDYYIIYRFLRYCSVQFWGVISKNIKVDEVYVRNLVDIEMEEVDIDEVETEEVNIDEIITNRINKFMAAISRSYEINSNSLIKSFECIDLICSKVIDLRNIYFHVISILATNVRKIIFDLLYKSVITGHCLNDKIKINRRSTKESYVMSTKVNSETFSNAECLILYLIQYYPMRTDILDTLIKISNPCDTLTILIQSKNKYLFKAFIEKYVAHYGSFDVISPLFQFRPDQYEIDILLQNSQLSVMEDISQYLSYIDHNLVRKLLEFPGMKTVNIFSNILYEYTLIRTVDNETILWILDELSLMKDYENNDCPSAIIHAIVHFKLEDKYQSFLEKLSHYMGSSLVYSPLTLRHDNLIIKCSLDLFRLIINTNKLLKREICFITDRLIEELPNTLEKIDYIASYHNFPLYLPLMSTSLLYPIVYKYPEISTKIGESFLLKYSLCPNVISTACNCPDIKLTSDTIDIILQQTAAAGAKDLFYYIIERFHCDPSPYIEILNGFKENINYEHTIASQPKIVRSRRSHI